MVEPGTKNKQEIAERERAIHEEDAAELARQRQEAGRRKVESDERRRLDELESKEQRERQVALAISVSVKRTGGGMRACAGALSRVSRALLFYTHPGGGRGTFATGDRSCPSRTAV